MYEAHYGLRARPFAETVSPAAYVSLPSRETVLRRLRYALDQAHGAAVLFGPPGTGKTMLVRGLAAARRSRCAHLAFPAMPPADLLGLLLYELGHPPGPKPLTIAGATRQLQKTLATAALKGERPLLVIDEAHLIDDPATFETLRLVLNFASAGPPDLALLLVGGPEMLLHLPPGLVDRLSARCLLGPLEEPESALYVAGRLALAGANDALFDPPSLTALHRASDGYPRRLNRLADLALLIAYAQGQPRPDAQTVAIAAREVKSEPLAA